MLHRGSGRLNPTRLRFIVGGSRRYTETGLWPTNLPTRGTWVRTRTGIHRRNGTSFLSGLRPARSRRGSTSGNFQKRRINLALRLASIGACGGWVAASHSSADGFCRSRKRSGSPIVHRRRAPARRLNLGVNAARSRSLSRSRRPSAPVIGLADGAVSVAMISLRIPRCWSAHCRRRRSIVLAATSWAGRSGAAAMPSRLR